MIRALTTAASGMKAQQLQVDTIANNIANANTASFKKSRLSFRSLLYETMREPGAPAGANQMNPSGLQVGSGTEVSGSYKVFEQGALEPTTGMLDLAIQGEGFFRVRLPNGDFRYTRDGSFRLDGNGAIVTPDGYPLDGAPAVPQDTTTIAIGDDGTISVANDAAALPSVIGQLGLFRFSNPGGLKAQGSNFFSETPSSGPPQQSLPGENGTGRMRQFAQERSNVQVVDELVALILAQRNYETNSRAIRASDEMLQQVNQMAR